MNPEETNEKNIKIVKTYAEKITKTLSEINSILDNDFEDYDGFLDMYPTVYDMKYLHKHIQSILQDLEHESMMVNASIKNPLIAKKVATASGYEIGIEKRFDNDGDLLVYQVFCEILEDNEHESFAEEFDTFDKFEPIVAEVGKGGLTEKQKKLPKKMQKAILKKMKKKKEISEEEAEAEYSKLLSKDDEKEYENTIEHEMKVKK